MRALVFETARTDYGIDQVVENRQVMTVFDLKRILEDYDDDDVIICSHDRGYTYGTLPQDFREYEQDEESGNWEEV